MQLKQQTTELPDSGQFTIGTTNVHWQQRAFGEVLFNAGEGADFTKLDIFLDKFPTDSMPQGADHKWLELQVANNMLAHHRPYCIPDSNGYYAASVVVTTDGRLFVNMNNEHAIKDSFEGRGCGETSALADAQRKTGNKDVQFRKTYLMSGMAEMEEATVAGEISLVFRDRKANQLSCLCGECRKNFRDHMTQGEFIMVPTNDGKRIIEMDNVGVQTDDEQRQGRMWVKPLIARRIMYGEMYPLVRTRLLTAEQSKLVHDGYLAITEHSNTIPDISTDLPANVGDLQQDDWHRVRHAYVRADKSIKSLNDHPTLANINTAMVQLIHEAYFKHAAEGQIPAADITVVLIKTNNNRFYPSVLVDGHEWLSSKPQAMATALSNGYNQRGIKEAYMMSFNNHQLQNERSATLVEGKSGLHSLKMPDPAALGRLIKNMRRGDTPLLHVIPVNDGTLSDERVRWLSGEPLDVRKSFGPGFEAPKQTLNNELGGSFGRG